MGETPGWVEKRRKNFKKSIDKSIAMWYNNYRKLRKGVLAMYLVTWKYTHEEKVQGAVMTSREAYLFGLNPCVEVLEKKFIEK